jgi:hypothetical protein
MPPAAVRPSRRVKHHLIALSAVIVLALTACAPEAPVTSAPQILRPPTQVTAVAGDGEVTVSWVPPTITENIRIYSYSVTSSTGETYESTGLSLSYTVTGLQNGTTYTFTVATKTGYGESEESEPSNEVTPSPKAADG